MQPKAPLVVFFLIVALAISAAIMIGVQSRKNAPPASAAEFQQLIGGLGFGPAVDLARCPNSFDPRLCARCSRDRGPIPGGRRLCPQHAGSIFYYRGLGSLR